MSLLNITKVSDAGERCWGVVLFDDSGVALLKSAQGVRKGEVTSIAKALKFEGPGAPIVLDGIGKPEGPAWVIEKADEGWLVRFTPVGTAFALMLKPEEARLPEAAEMAVKVVKDCLTHVDIQWDPPEADPAYQEKVTDETEIAGIPGSGPQLSAAMQEKLNDFAKWAFEQVRVLESPVLLILDYSPRADQRPLSIAFDYGGGAKCWMTAAKVRKIDEDGPNFCEDYKEFAFERQQFMPYSIRQLPGSIFENIDELKAACRRLYRHVVWT